jgi:hypothetical protein
VGVSVAASLPACGEPSPPEQAASTDPITTSTSSRRRTANPFYSKSRLRIITPHTGEPFRSSLEKPMIQQNRLSTERVTW